MLNSSKEVIFRRENSDQHMLFDDIVRQDQYYDDLGKLRHRLHKSTPNIQSIVLTDMDRSKMNKIYERKLDRELSGPRGLNWQYKHELQRLESDQRHLKRFSVDLAKMSLLPSISQSSSFHRNHTPRLSAIIEETPSLPIIETAKIRQRCSLPVSSNQIKPTQQRSSMSKINFSNEHSHSVCKQYLQQVVAKTSDDRSYFQQHAYLINQQKRMIEQKLKEFLH
ncbi:unnamed protein product [Adineta steineri]|uniref:Uncharacterized protein n=2 Tax=Adineta steineri TaxID=433720 RepID=A0A815SJD2_9BILA|nr:unnamed protein product [Adineta steineri]CAF3709925.1 unnamed protein product [Adineta steineri]